MILDAFRDAILGTLFCIGIGAMLSLGLSYGLRNAVLIYIVIQSNLPRFKNLRNIGHHLFRVGLAIILLTLGAVFTIAIFATSLAALRYLGQRNPSAEPVSIGSGAITFGVVTVLSPAAFLIADFISGLRLDITCGESAALQLEELEKMSVVYGAWRYYVATSTLYITPLLGAVALVPAAFAWLKDGNYLYPPFYLGGAGALLIVSMLSERLYSALNPNTALMYSLFVLRRYYMASNSSSPPPRMAINALIKRFQSKQYRISASATRSLARYMWKTGQAVCPGDRRAVFHSTEKMIHAMKRTSLAVHPSELYPLIVWAVRIVISGDPVEEITSAVKSIPPHFLANFNSEEFGSGVSRVSVLMSKLIAPDSIGSLAAMLTKLIGLALLVVIVVGIIASGKPISELLEPAKALVGK
jgi:hypothetical protein